MPYINVPKGLRETLGEEASDDLVKLLNQREDETRNDTIDLIEQRFHRHLAEELAAFETRRDQTLQETFLRFRRDITTDLTALRSELKDDISELRSEVKADMDGLRNEFKADMDGLRAELKGDIAELREDFTEKLSRGLTEAAEDRAAIRGEMARGFEEAAEDRAAIREEIQLLRQEISKTREQFHAMQTSNVRWMFLFWVGQVGAIAGLLIGLAG